MFGISSNSEETPYLHKLPTLVHIIISIKSDSYGCIKMC